MADDVRFIVGADIAPYRNAMRRLGPITRRTTGGLRTSFAAVGTGVTRLTSSIFNLRNAILGLGIGLTVRSFFQFATALQDSEVQLRAVAGGALKAKAILEDIRAFSVELPLTTLEVVQAFVLLKSVGIANAKAVTKTLTNVAIAMNRSLVDVATAIIGLETEVLRRLGVTLTRTGQTAVIQSAQAQLVVKNTTTAIREGIIKVFDISFRDAMRLAQDSFTTATSTMLSEWQFFQNNVLKAGLFQFIVLGIRKINAQAAELRRSGVFEEIGQQLFEGTINSVVTFLGKVDELRRTFGPALTFIRLKLVEFVSGALSVFQNLPTEIQAVGLVGFLMFGKLGKVGVLGALAAASSEFGKLAVGRFGELVGTATPRDKDINKLRELQIVLQGVREEISRREKGIPGGLFTLPGSLKDLRSDELKILTRIAAVEELLSLKKEKSAEATDKEASALQRFIGFLRETQRETIETVKREKFLLELQPIFDVFEKGLAGAEGAAAGTKRLSDEQIKAQQAVGQLADKINDQIAALRIQAQATTDETEAKILGTLASKKFAAARAEDTKQVIKLIPLLKIVKEEAKAQKENQERLATIQKQSTATRLLNLNKERFAVNRLLAEGKISQTDALIAVQQTEEKRARIVQDTNEILLRSNNNLVGAFMLGLRDAGTATASTFDAILQLGKDTAQGLQRGFSDLFFDVFTNRANSLKDTFLNLVNSMLRAISDFLGQQAVQLFLGLGGGRQRGGGIGGIFGSLIGGIGSLFGGGGGPTPLASLAASTGRITSFQGGGSLQKDQPVLVGERGTELFIPHMAGTIVPHEDIKSQEGDITVQIINNISAGVPEAVQQEFLRLRPMMKADAIEAILAARNRGGKVAKAFGQRKG